MRRTGNDARRSLSFLLLPWCLLLGALCGVAGAATPVTATLTVSPGPLVKRGDTVKFQADVRSEPAFVSEYLLTPGAILRTWVTTSDFSWVSDKLDVQYPGTGSVHIAFNNGFTIPANAGGGKVYDFYLVFGIWYPISEKASVKVGQVLNKGVTLRHEKLKSTVPAPAR